MDAARRSAGFGRIGGEARPSLYSPVHLASRPWPDQPPAANGPHAVPRAPVTAGVVVIVAVLLAVVAAVASRSRPATDAPRDVVSDAAPALEAEAERLLRSALATFRRPA